MLITQHFVSHAVQPTVTTIINQEFSSMSMYDITAEKSKTMSLMTSSLNEDYTSAYIIDRSKTIIFKSSSSEVTGLIMRPEVLEVNLSGSVLGVYSAPDRRHRIRG